MKFNIDRIEDGKFAVLINYENNIEKVLEVSKYDFNFIEGNYVNVVFDESSEKIISLENDEVKTSEMKNKNTKLLNNLKSNKGSKFKKRP